MRFIDPFFDPILVCTIIRYLARNADLDCNHHHHLVGCWGRRHTSSFVGVPSLSRSSIAPYSFETMDGKSAYAVVTLVYTDIFVHAAIGRVPHVHLGQLSFMNHLLLHFSRHE